jgi:predicted ATP-binding protein involved in virulence
LEIPLTIQLQQFSITGLHGNRNVDIPIRDNKLVLVGENGTGKSTIANFIFFFLAREWRRMTSYNFESVSMLINDELFQIENKYLTPRSIGRSRTELPLNLSSLFTRLEAQYGSTTILEEPGLLRRLSDEYHVPSSVLFEYFRHNPHMSDDEIKQWEKHNNELNIMRKKLSDVVNEQILYLPTYRRIERELQQIFPKEDLDELRTRNRRLRKGRNEETFIELVEFGMEDIENTITATMSTLGEILRRRLNSLTGSYLREVIQGKYDTVNVAPLRELDESSINAVLDRVGENLLSAEDKATLREIIEKINSNDSIEERDKVIVHFLISLIELHKQQDNNEKAVRDFITVCNKYLIDKNLVYDSRHYQIRIEHERPHGDIKLQQLSSGEKQIVSLFAHIYLSDQANYFVIIDEPELSLSVTWQKQFLPDIWATGKCSGIIAVTHSPYIFDNDFDNYTHGLEEFWITTK